LESYGGESVSFAYFGEEVETLTRTVEGRTVKVHWNWGKFKTTESFPVDESMINWVIGQEQALNEGFLCLNEWVHKLKHLEETQWYASWSNVDGQKPPASATISPGPYLLLLGDPGTGKSLLGKALAEKLTQVYEENGIKLFDVLSWKNSSMPSQPRISIHKVGEGKKIQQKEQLKELKRKFTTKIGLKAIAHTGNFSFVTRLVLHD
jgi:predicted ATP-dependent protease